MSSEKFFDLTPDGRYHIMKIEPEAAKIMAKILSETAENLERQAKRFDKTTLEKVAQYSESRHVDIMIAMMIDAGKSLDETIEELATFDISERDIRYLWKHIGRRVARFKARQRQKTARRMARAGKSNAAIAAALNVSTRTVCRLLSGKP